MSPIVTRPAPPLAELRAERAAHRRMTAVSGPTRWHESALVFCVTYAAYAALGLYTTLALKIVLGDAQSRLAHAYFVWWNEPPKLTAIGFYWPPLQTLVLLPFALAKPVATSLVALPLQSALFMALLVTVLSSLLATTGLERRLRLAVVAGFALNPMILYFAVNGMGESLYLLLLTLGLAVVVRWAERPRWQALPLAGVAFALGILARYEVGFWLPLAAIGVVLVLVRARAPVQRIEAAIVALLTPAVYVVALWAYVNWSLTGDPTEFLAVANAIQEAPHGTALGYVGATLATQAALFPFAFVLCGVLLWLGVRRRSGLALVLAAALLVNALLTMAFAIHTREEVPLLLRYNMRSIPITVVAGAWLVAAARPERRRRTAALVAAGLFASMPATAATMLVAENQLGESSFLRALVTGESQDGRPGPEGPGLSMADQRDMARYIVDHVDGRNAVLADDSQAFGVMLADGDPGRYLDRIDFGETRWLEVLRRPVGRVGYVLVKRDATRTADPVFYDRILQAYPGLGAGEPPPFAQLVHENATFALYRIRNGR